ncbi:MAG: hypothetical protein R3301_18040 [Saprospiraceae bacterium]|nr:hypothetical protein [Saprospiraceae bacterium]
MSPLAFFLQLIHNLEQDYTHLTRTRMLSSPAIEYKGRVFAFCQRGQMVIKLGSDEQLIGLGVRATPGYQPFMNQVVLSQWREVPFYYREDWREIAEMALNAVKAEIDPVTA